MSQAEATSSIRLTRLNSNTNLLYSLIIFEIGFYFAYRFGMAFTDDYPSPLWFPDSVLLCALLVSPRSKWWMYILAQIPIRFFLVVNEGAMLWFLVVCFLNDSLKALLAASLLRRRSEDAPWFHSLRGFATYLLVVVTLAPAISAVIGAASHAHLGGEFWPAWRQWFFGNALASLSLTPALCCLFLDLPSVIHVQRTRRNEILLIIVGLAVGTCIALTNGLGDLRYPLWVLYLSLPFVLWAAFRFGPLGTSVVLTSVSIVAMFGALSGQGAFSPTTGQSAVLFIQQFLLIPSIPFLLLSVLITASRKTEATLRENVQSLRSLLNTTPILVWTSDTDGLRTFFSQHWVEFTGWPLAGQLGNGWTENVHPEDRERLEREYRAALQVRKQFIIEYRIRRFDGEYRWVLESGIPNIQSGTVLGYVGSCIDVTDRREAQHELSMLATKLLDAQETERQRIGQELHDDLGQRLVSLKLGIERLTERLPQDEGPALNCDDLRQQASDIIKNVSRLSHQLRPIGLEYLGLPDALKALCVEASDPTRVTVDFSQHGKLPAGVPPNVSLALYRIAQEALRNALTHSGSDRISMDLTMSGVALTLAITDHGRGFDPSTNAFGLGLSGMAKRMRDIGGALTIVSLPDAGTTITASIEIAHARSTHR